MSTRGVAPAVPDVVAERQRWAREHGFERSCTDDVGRLLAWLAGGLAPGSQVLELGSGAGVGLAWLASGAAEATGVHITSIERDPVLAAALRDVSWPAEVNLVEGDSLKFVRDSQDGFDLVFADAEGGKTTGLTATVSRVRSPGGLLVVDDMAW